MLLDKAESPWSGHGAPTPGKIARFNRNDEFDDSGVVCWSRYSVGRCLRSPATGLTSKRYSIALRLWRSCPAPIPPTYGFPVAGFMGRVSRSGFGSNQTWLDRADVKRNGWSPMAAGVFGGSV